MSTASRHTWDVVLWLNPLFTAFEEIVWPQEPILCQFLSKRVLFSQFIAKTQNTDTHAVLFNSNENIFFHNYMQKRSWTIQRPCTLEFSSEEHPFLKCNFRFSVIILPLNYSSFSIYSTSLDSCSEPSLSSSQTNDFLFCQSELMKEHKHDENLFPVILLWHVSASNTPLRSVWKHLLVLVAINI